MDGQLFSLALVAGGLALFLHGLEFSAESFRSGLGGQARRVTAAMGRSRPLSFLFGSVMALLSQSTTAATAFAVGLVDVGALSFSSSLLVMMGASVGTTLVVFLLSLDLVRWSPLLLALALLAERAGPRRFAPASRLASAVALLLMGMFLIDQGVRPLTETEALRELILEASHNALLLGLLSLAATALFQSSVPVLGLAIALASGGFLSSGAYLPVILGSRIGNAATVLLAGQGGRHNARALALSTLVFRVVGVVALLPFCAPLSRLAGRIAPSPGGQIAWLQFFVAWINVGLLLPLSERLGRLCQSRAVRRRKDIGEPRFLDPELARYPHLALSLLAREMIGLANYVEELTFLSLHCLKEGERVEALRAGTPELARRAVDFVVAMTPPPDDDAARAEYAALTYSMAALKEVVDIVAGRMAPLCSASGPALLPQRRAWSGFASALGDLVGESLGVLALGDREGIGRASGLLRRYEEREEALRSELTDGGFHPDSPDGIEAWSFLAASASLARASMELVRGETLRRSTATGKEV